MSTRNEVNIIGEEYIPRGDHEKAIELAERMCKEAASFWTEESNSIKWRVTVSNENVKVEITDITEGPFARSGLILARARLRIHNHSYLRVIRHLCTPEGFTLIDPNSNPEDFAKSLDSFTGWRNEKTKLKV